MILMIYNQDLFRECLLPNIRDEDYWIELDKDTFHLRKSVKLKLEASGSRWILYAAQGYKLRIRRSEIQSRLLENGDIIEVCTDSSGTFRLIAADTAVKLTAAKKYRISGSGEIRIGKGEGQDICFDFNGIVSSSHALIEYASCRARITNLSVNGTFVNHIRTVEPRELFFGDRIDIFGLHLVYLDGILAITSQTGEFSVKSSHLAEMQEPEPIPHRQELSKTCYFNRAPRKMPEIHDQNVEIEPPPAQAKENKRPLLLTIGPAFTMAIPMILGITLAMVSMRSRGNYAGGFMYTGIITAVGAAFFGVLWGVLNLRYARKEAREEEQYRFDAYSRYLIRISESLRRSYKHNSRALRKIYPSARACTSFDSTSASLWNRNFTHKDVLFVRLGTGTIPFQVNISIPKEKFTLMNDMLVDKPRQIRDEFRTLEKVPVGISLDQDRLVGLVGEGDGALALMYIITAQLAATLSYTDLKMVFIYDRQKEGARKKWDFLRWFPHVWSEDHGIRFIAGDPSERGEVFYELTNMIRLRSRDQSGASSRKSPVKPQYVLFISDPALLANQMITTYLYHPQDAYGTVTFLMVPAVDHLPNECEYIIQNDRSFRGIYRLMDLGRGKKPVDFDFINASLLEKQARNLSQIQVREAEKYKEIPDSIDFFDLYGASDLEDFHISDRWRKNRTYDSLRVPIGKKGGGVDCGLDIDEKYHGPHGLVAGTTGSGKSELLQTYILSMAVNFSPEDVRFLLIDFKGGGMANLFDNLPHLAGKITNLSGSQIQRAMISIHSENQRRERIFASYGIKKIEQYTRLYKSGEASVPLPHHLIIVDEFAELKKEYPEFMSQIISVATVGRALGIHLILATQKPGGTVDDHIRTNTRFRLCLRVQDKQDSSDMLHRPDAAYITLPGRGYLQVGTDEIFEEFQSAYSGAAYDPRQGHSDRPVVRLLNRIGKPALVGASPSRPEGNWGREKTQLDALVEYMNGLSARYGYDSLKPLWLPELPETVYLEAVPGYGDHVWKKGRWPVRESLDLTACIGMYDDPVNRRQGMLLHDFIKGGNLAVFGQVASGKSTLLQTLLFSLLCRYPSDALNAYVLDYSSNLFTAFAGSRSVGAVIGGNEQEQTDRFFHMLKNIMEERRRQIASGSYEDYVRTRGTVLPAILIILDGFASFREKTGDRYLDLITGIAREGNRDGIFLVAGASSIGMQDMNRQLFDTFRTVISLEQNEKFKYQEVLRMPKLSMIPDAGIRGRGLCVLEGRSLEFQTALALPAPDIYERDRAVSDHLEELNASMTSDPARAIPQIPDEPVYSDLTALPEFASALKSREALPLGWYRQDAAVFCMDLRRTFCYTVSGSKDSGKKALLRQIAATALSAGGRVMVIEPSGSEWKSFSEKNHFTYYEGAAGIFSFGRDMTPAFRERNQIKHGVPDGEDIFDRINQEQQIFVLITDLAGFAEKVANPGEGIGRISGFMENILRAGSLHGIYLIAALSSEDAVRAGAYPVYRQFTEYHQGIHLGGKVSSLRFYDFQNLSARESSRPSRKGLGLVRSPEDETMAVQVVVPGMDTAGRK